MSDKDLIKKVRELDQLATPGPWFCGGQTVSNWNVGVDPQPEYLIEWSEETAEPQAANDARFIAEARALVPVLAASLEKALTALSQAERDKAALREKIEGLRRYKSRGTMQPDLDGDWVLRADILHLFPSTAQQPREGEAAK